jgi:hypothetical protein
MFRKTAQKLSTAAALIVLGTAPTYAQKSGEVTFGDPPPGKRVRVSVDAAVGYDDNTYTSNTDEVESFFSTLGANVAVNLGDTRTNLDLSLGGSATWYPDRNDSDWDYSANFSARAFHDLNERFDVYASVNVAYEVEPDYGDVFTTNRRDGDYFYTNISAGVTSSWTQRFDTVTNFNFVTINYVDDLFGDFYDRQEYGFSNSFRFALEPDVFLAAEYRFRYFDHQEDSQDAFSHYALVGVDAQFSERLSVNFRVGAEFRDYDSIGSNTAPYFESTVTYLGSNRSSISWVSRIGYEVTDTINYDERYTYRTGINWNQGITSRLRGNLGVYYQHNDFKGDVSALDDISEDVISLEAGLIFAVSRNLQLNTGYSFSKVLSDDEFREYDRNVYHAGLKLLF